MWFGVWLVVGVGSVGVIGFDWFGFCCMWGVWLGLRCLVVCWIGVVASVVRVLLVCCVVIILL